MDLNQLTPVAITFVVVGIVLAFGVTILGSVKDDFAAAAVGVNCGQNSTGGTGAGLNYNACGADYNGTLSAIEAEVNVADKLPLLGLVIAAAIIIGVLLKAFSSL